MTLSIIIRQNMYKICRDMRISDVAILRKKDRKVLGVPKWFLEGAFNAEVVFLKDEEFFGIPLPMEWLINRVPYFLAIDCVIDE